MNKEPSNLVKGLMLFAGVTLYALAVGVMLFIATVMF